MQIVITMVLIFLAVFFICLAVFGLIAGKRNSIHNRLKDINKTARTQEMNEEALTAEIEIGQIGQRTKTKNSYLEKYYQRLSIKLEKAHLLYRPREYFLLSLGMAILFALIFYIILQIRFPAMNVLGLLSLIVFSGVLGFFIPNSYLSIRESKMRSLLSSQVGDMILLLSNYLRAGHSFTRAIELVSREVPSPLADELKKFSKDVSLGGSFEEALADLEKRTEDEDLGLVITAIQIQHQVGGNLAEVLDSINNTIRERIRLKGEIKTLTAQGRLSAIVLVLLPFVVALIITFMNPEYMGVLFKEPAGLMMLALGVFFLIMGIVFIRKIVQIQV